MSQPPYRSQSVSQPNSSLLELAWAAGFYDGEGSTFAHVQRPGIGRRNSSGYVAIKISISQTDRRPLDRFLNAVKLGYVNGPYEVAAPKKGKAAYLYRASGKEAEEVLELLSPYLSDPKCEQIENAKARIVEVRQDFLGQLVKNV